MKLYQDQSDPATPMLPNNATIDAQDVIAAIANASHAEFPSALE